MFKATFRAIDWPAFINALTNYAWAIACLRREYRREYRRM